MGRTKIDNVEIDDDDAPRKSHKTLATIEDDAGGELAILRDNMPFGRPGAGEFGTYFIGYSGRLWVIEQMLERMFVGVPPGSLRPAARLLDRDHRDDVLRADGGHARGAGRAAGRPHRRGGGPARDRGRGRRCVTRVVAGHRLAARPALSGALLAAQAAVVQGPERERLEGPCERRDGQRAYRNVTRGLE